MMGNDSHPDIIVKEFQPIDLSKANPPGLRIDFFYDGTNYELTVESGSDPSKTGNFKTGRNYKDIKIQAKDGTLTYTLRSANCTEH